MCKSCEALMINGVLCHETGCPDAWKGKQKECRECGCEFTPEDKYDQFCSEDCFLCFHGMNDANVYEIDDVAMSYNQTYVGQA